MTQTAATLTAPNLAGPGFHHASFDWNLDRPESDLIERVRELLSLTTENQIVIYWADQHEAFVHVDDPLLEDIYATVQFRFL